LPDGRLEAESKAKGAELSNATFKTVLKMETIILTNRRMPNGTYGGVRGR